MDEETRRRRILSALNTLRVFEAVARHGSFTQAAAELGMAQSAVSRQVRGLENMLNVPLLWRTTRQVEVTEQGRFYAQVIRGAIDTIEAGTQELIGGQKGAVVLAVGAPSAFSMRWLLPRLADFRARHPEILLKIASADEPGEVVRQKLDAAICFGRGGIPRSLQAERLFSEPLALVCSPSLMAGDNPPREIAALRHHRLLHTSTLSASWERWLRQAGIPQEMPRGGPPMEDLFLVLQATLVGLGVALLPYWLIQEELAKGLLVLPLGEGPAASGGHPGAAGIPSITEEVVFVAPRQKARFHRVRAFREWLLEQVAGEAGAEADTQVAQADCVA